MDAVLISNNSYRLSITLPLLLQYFHVAVVPPVQDVKSVNDFMNRYKRAGDEKFGSPAKQISLTLTHLHIWNTSRRYTNNTYLYVFEDDALPQKDYMSECALREMEQLSPPIFHLGTCSPKHYGNTRTKACGKTFWCSSLCLHAYAVRIRTSHSLAKNVLDSSHSQSLHGHSLYRYNLDVKLRGYMDKKKEAICPGTEMVVQQKWNSSSGHSKCCAW